MFTGNMMVGASAACGLLVVILVCTIPASLSAPYPLLQGYHNFLNIIPIIYEKTIQTKNNKKEAL